MYVFGDARFFVFHAQGNCDLLGDLAAFGCKYKDGVGCYRPAVYYLGVGALRGGL